MQDATPAQHARCGVQAQAPLGVCRQASPPPQRRAADRTDRAPNTPALKRTRSIATDADQRRRLPPRQHSRARPHERSGALHSHLALSHVALSHLVLPSEVEQCLVHNSITTPQRKHLRARTNKQTRTRARGKARLSQRETELRRIEAWTGGGPSRAVLAVRYASRESGEGSAKRSAAVACRSAVLVATYSPPRNSLP